MGWLNAMGALLGRLGLGGGWKRNVPTKMRRATSVGMRAKRRAISVGTIAMNVPDPAAAEP
jgi:hypothetical protein